jgi:hypothetical protein
MWMAQDPDTADNCGGNPTRVAQENSAFIALLARLQDAQAGGAGGPKVRVGGEVRDFLRAKLALEGAAHGLTTVAGDIDTLRHGGSSTVGGVKVALIAAHHSNGIPLSLVGPAT